MFYSKPPKPPRSSKGVKARQHNVTLMALEPRMMFDGAAVATAAVVMSDSAAPPADAAPHVDGGPDHHEAAPAAMSTDAVPSHDAASPDHWGYAGTTATPVPTSYIFIDTAVEGYEGLAAEWAGKGEIVLIDATRDGIDQVLASLAGKSEIDSIHFVSHGAANTFALGTTIIDANALAGDLRGAFASIGAKLSIDGDILIYGCDVTIDDAGQRFIDAVAATTKADVAASDDKTGNAGAGGNWILESRSGSIESDVLASDRFDGLLQLSNPSTAYTINTNVASTVIDGVTASITFTNGTGNFTAPTGGGTLNNIDAFANGAKNTQDATTTFNAPVANATGTITITFSEAVTNPIVHIDRLGGVAGGQSNSATLTLATAGATMTKVAGVNHFVVSGNTITRTANVASAGSESSLDGATGTAAGSVMISGTYTTLTFNVVSTAADGFEISTSLDRAPDAVNDNFAINRGQTLTGTLFANNGNGADADVRGDATTITRINGATFTTGTAITLSAGTLTITNATTGAFTFVPSTSNVGAQTFTYTIADANGGTDTATATIAINDVPLIALNPTNLVVNGSFENSAAWTSDVGGLEANSPGVFGAPAAPDGSRVAEVEGSTGARYIQQTIATVAGQQYAFSTQATTRANANVGDKGSLYVNGAKVLDFTTNAQYQTFVATFTATSASTVIRIQSEGSTSGSAAAPTDGSGLIVDDVQVRAINTAVSYTENAAPVAITATGDRIFDFDNANMTSATVTLTNPQAADRLLVNGSTAASGTIGAIGYTLTATTVSFSGAATKAQYEAAIRAVQFDNTSDAPSIVTRTITVVASDGTATSNTATVAVSVTAVNDAPVNTLPTGYSVVEDGVLALTGIQVADVDAASGTITVTLAVPAGTGTLAATAGTGVAVSGSGTSALVLTGTVADLNAYLAGASRPTFAQSVADFNGTVTLTMTTGDGGNTGTGGAASDVDTATITITPVADLVADTITIDEDTSGTAFVLLNDSFENAGARVTSVDGVAVTPGTSIAVTPPTNYNGSYTVNYLVTAGGVTEAGVLTVIVRPVNDVPAGADAVFTAVEDTPFIFAAANFGFSDSIEGDSFAGILITTLAANGTLLLNGSPVAAGTFVTAAQIAGGQFSWRGAANARGTGLGSFTFQVRDTGGTANGGIDTDQSPNSISFNVTSVNDAPAGTDAVLSALEDTPYVLTAGNFGFSDAADGDAFDGVILTTVPANGTLRLNGSAVAATSYVTAAQINAGLLTWQGAANANGAGLGSFTFQVRDTGGTANGGTDTDQSANSISFAVTAVNDAPAGTDAVLTALEDVPYAFTAANFGFTDTLDGNGFAGVTITTLPANGNLLLAGSPVGAGTFVTAAQIAAGQLTWQSAVNANGPGRGAFTFQVRDNGGVANGGIDTDQSPNSISFTVVAVNDAPTGTDATLAATEDTPFVFVPGNFGFSDAIDGDSLAAVVITTIPANGSLLLNGAAVSAGSVVTAAQIAAGRLTWQGAANANGAGLGSFTFQVRDGAGTANGGVDTDQTPNTIAFDVAAVNDAPVLDLNGGAAGIDYAASYTEDGAPVAIAAATVSVGDIDSGSIQSASFVIVNGSAGDLLAVAGTLPAGITASYNAATYTLTLTGTATPSAYATAIAQLTYSTVSDTPATTARTIRGTVTDNAGLASTTATATIGVAASNDPIANSGRSYSVAEDGAVALSGLSITDPDAAGGVVTVALAVPSGAGIITAASTAAVTVSGSGGAGIVLSGTLADINAYLASAATQPVFRQGVADFVGTIQLTMTSNDNGNTGAGGATTATSLHTITVTAVTDIVADSVTGNEDSAITVAPLANDSFENAGARITAVAGQSIAPGGSVAVANGVVTLDNADRLTFTPAANFSGTASFAYTVTSGGVSESANVTVTVNAVNDRPTLITPTTIAATEDVAVAITGISLADVDAGTGIVTATFSVATGTLSLAASTGVSVSANGTDSIVLTGQIAAINAAIAGSRLTYAPPANLNGSVTLTTTVNDRGNVGIDPGTSGDAASEEASATTSIVIAAVNDAPVARDDSFATNESMPVTFAVLDNDDDVDTAALTITAIDGTAIATGGSVAVTGGSVRLNADRTLTFSPNAGFSGTPSFTYTASDGALSSTATVFGVVGSINHAPDGTDRVVAIVEDSSYIFSGATFGYSDVLDGNAFTGVVIATIPANGILALNGTPVTAGTFVTAAQLAAGQLTWTPAANAFGSGLGSFDFRVRDDGGTVNGGRDTDLSANTISFDVAPVNDAPQGTDVVLAATEDQPHVFAAADFGFADPIGGDGFAGVVITTIPGSGTLTLDGVAVAPGSFVTAARIAAGALRWAPDANANGAGLGSFTFQVRDDGGTADGGIDTDQTANLIRFDVAAVNDAPVANGDSFTVAEDTAITIDPRTNDVDIDAGAVLTVTAIDGHAIVIGGPAVAVAGGSVTLDAQGRLVFTPAADFAGAISFTYTVRDEAGAVATATITGTVTAVTDPVVNIRPGIVAGTEDTAIVFSAANGTLVAVSDPDNGILTVTLAADHGVLTLSRETGLTFAVGSGIGDRTMTFTGTAAAINAALAELRFDPDADFNGPAQVSIATQRAPDGATDADIIMLSIGAATDGVADNVTTAEDTPISFNVLTGTNGASADRFADPDRRVTAVTQPAAGRGAVTFDASGQLTYTPPADFTGTVSFAYTVTAGGVDETVAVTVTVTPVDDAPILDLDGATAGTGHTAVYVENGAGIAIVGSAVVTDIDSALTGATIAIRDGAAGDLLSVAGALPSGIVARYDAATFTLTLSGTATPAAYQAALATIRYASAADRPATGPRHIDISVGDGQLSSATATTSVTIVQVNDAPTGADAVLHAIEDTPYALTAADFGFADVAEGDGFAGVVIATAPVSGTLLLAGSVVAPGSFVTAAQIAAGQLTFVAGMDANGSGLGAFGFQVRDLGGTADGGIDTDQSVNTIRFDVANVNDAPVSSDGTAATLEDVPVSATLPGHTDVDGDVAIYRAGTTTPAHGIVRINSDGSYTYTPAANFHGTDIFSFIVDDGRGGTVEEYVTLTIAAVNDTPVPTSPIPNRTRPDGATVTFDTSTYFADADGDPLDFIATGLPAGLTMGADGVIRGTIDAAASQGGPNADGIYTIAVTATDPAGASTSSSFSFTVTNPAPTAVNDSATTAEDTPVTFNLLDGSASGGVADSDPDNDLLTIVDATAGNGTVTIGTGGTITYTPAADWNGTDTIVYTISDGQGGLAQAVARVVVTAVNDSPVATPIADRMRNDGDVVAFDASGFFTDPEGAALTFSATGLPPGLGIDPITGVISGTIAAGASGATGTSIYTITVTAADGQGGQASLVYRNTVVNIAPNAVDDAATVGEDGSVDIAILANDSDTDGDGVAVVRVNNQLLTVGGPAIDTANGQVMLVNVAGVMMLRFVPDANYNGTESFTYSIDDANGGIDVAVVTVMVAAVNDSPTGPGSLPDRVRADGQTLTYELGDFFRDPDGDDLNFVITGLPPGLVYNLDTGLISGVLDRAASQGGPNNDGVYTVTVTAYDGAGATGERVTRSFAITATNPGPSAINDAIVVNEDVTTTFAVIGNDIDPDGDMLTVTAANAGHGFVTINPNNTLTYTPDANFNGVDTIIYTISDGNGGVSSASVTITVNAVNDAPTADPIPALMSSDDAAITFDISGYFNDVDADADLDFTIAGTIPAGLTFDGETGVFSGMLAADASANSPYVITLTARDDSGATVQQTLNWTIQNLPPHAFSDTLRVGENGAVVNAGNVLQNDTDPDNDGKVVGAVNADPALVGRPVTGTNGGIFVVNADGSYSFDPGTAFDDLQVGESRTTLITYLLDDTDGGTDTATITVTVDGANDAPTATTIPQITGADKQIVTDNPVDVASFFNDADGDSLTFAAVGLPAGLTMDSGGRITGTIGSGASTSGPYTVEVTATDDRGATTLKTFTYVVTNPAPVASNDSASTVEDVAIDIDVIANDADVDGDTLFVDPAFPPQAANGTVTVNANGTLHYVPNADYNGIDTIIYRVSDGQGGLNSAVVNVQVGVVNDAPVGTDIPDTARNDGDSVSIATSGFFADVDGDQLSYSVMGLPQGLGFDPATGVISGRIAANASGSTGRTDYSVQVTADDNHGGSTTVTFVLSAINIAPQANGDSAMTDEDSAVDIAVLANDGDIDGDGIAVIRINNVSLVVGSSVATADGVVTLIDKAGVLQLRFVPNANFNGHTAFSYTIGDGNGGFDDAVVNIMVVATNDGPIASAPIPDRMRADGSSVSFDVSAFFDDIDGDALTYSAAGLPPGLTFDPATGVIGGSLSASASQGGTNGRYTVTIVARDPSGATATQAFDFTATNPPPRAANDIVTMAEDGSVTFDPVTGLGTDGGTNGADVDPDGDVLRIVTVAGGQPIRPGSSVTLQTGTLTMNGDGSLTFAPVADFNGPATITYTVSDGNGGTAQAVITVLVTAVDDTPTIDLNGAAPGTGQADIYTEGDAPLIILSGDGAAFDVEDEITSLDIALTGFVDAGQELIHLNGRVDFIVGTPSSGTIAFGGSDFRYSYDGNTILHVENAAGGAQPIEREAVSALMRALQYENRSEDPTTGLRTLVFTVADRGGNVSAPATATIQMVAVNDAPSATAIAAQAGGDAGLVSLDVSGFFADAEDVLAYAATGLPAGLAIDSASGIISGTIDRAASLGSPYTVVITADDGQAAVQRSFIWTIANPAPVAANDMATVGENASITGDVTDGSAGQDSDPDGDTLVVSAVDGVAGNVGIAVAGSTGGRFTIAADGSYSFDANGDFEALGAGESRLTEITYRISDGQGGTGTATVSVVVTGANDAPVAGSIAPRSDSDGVAVTLDTAGAFTDSDLGDVLGFAATGLPPGLTIDANTGEIVGTIAGDASAYGPYAVTVFATDRSGVTANTSFVWAVANVAPVAADASVVTVEDQLLSGSVSASDNDGDSLTYTLAAAPTYGSITLDPAGTYTYVPDADFTGVDRFTYRADDGQGGSITATVTINVTPAGDAPVASDDSFVTSQNAPVTIDVRSNDRDADGQVLAVSQIDGIAIATGSTVATVDGAVRLNEDGTLTYAPRRGYSGAPQFTYTLSDGSLSATGTVRGTVSAVNDPPVIDTAVITTPEDTMLVGQVGARDANGDPIVFTLLSGPSHGTITLADDGSFTYAPNGNFNGSDSFIVSVMDDNGGSSIATIPLEVTAVNDAPIVGGVGVVVGEDGAVTGEIVAVDSDNATLTYAVTVEPANGAVVVASDGSYTYTPRADFSGEDRFDVVVEDGAGGSEAVTVFVTVTAVQDAPTASAGAIAVDEDSAVSGRVLGADADGDPLNYAVAVAPAHGVVTLSADGGYTYSPDADFFGDDSFAVLVSDGNGGTVTVTIPVAVTAVNDLPVASAAGIVIVEDGQGNGQIVANDRDGDPLTYAVETGPTGGSVTLSDDGGYSFTPNADFNGTDSFVVRVDDGSGGVTLITVPVTITAVNDVPQSSAKPVVVDEDLGVTGLVEATDRDGNALTFTIVTSPEHGTVTIDASGTYRYVPAADFNGSDSFVVRVADGNGGTTDVVVPVSVAPVNDAPAITPETINTIADTPIDGRIMASDVDGDALVYRISVAPARGTLELGDDGSYRYTPMAGFIGSDSFAIAVSDGRGAVTIVTVVATVASPNTAPVDRDESIVAAQDQPITIDVLANATDVDGDTLRIADAQASSGTVIVNPDGTITYSPAAGFTGTATIAYTVTDGRGGTTSARILVTVAPAGVDVAGLIALAATGDQSPDNGTSLDASDARVTSAKMPVATPRIILDAVNGVRGLAGTADLSLGAPVSRAVEAIATLDGTADLGGPLAPVDTVVRTLDRHTILRSDVDRVFDNRFDPFAVDTQTGFSLRNVSEGQLALESVVRGDVLYLEMSDQGGADDVRLVEYQLRSRDGRPMPSWIKIDRRGLAIIERPVDADQVRFIVVGIRRDGSRIELPVIIQGETGEVQRDVDLPPEKAAKRLGAMMPSPASRAAAEASRLASAFGD